MTEQEDTRKKSRKDLLLILLILPFGVLCMFMAGQVAIQLAPRWVLNADMRSLLDPNATFVAQGIPPLIEPINPAILTRPAWGNLFLTPQAVIPTRILPTPTPSPVRTLPPPPVPTKPVEKEEPTPTLTGPIIIPTNAGPAEADLKIEISDNSRTYTPGTSITYNIFVTNLGPDSAPRFNVTDEIPAVISALKVNCTPAAYCGTNTSNGNKISYTNAGLPYNGVITITVSGTIASNASGDLVNTASAELQGARIRDPNPNNNSVTDTDTQLSVFDLAITKSDGVDTYVVATPLQYTVVVTNSGPSDATDIRVRDIIPPQIASWTWTCANVVNASRCTGANSSSNFNDTVDIGAGGRIEYSVFATPVAAPAAQNPQNLINTVMVVFPNDPRFTDPNLNNNSATDTDIPYIDVEIIKDDMGAVFTPGGALTYTITVTNYSAFNLYGLAVSDLKPSQVTTWAWCVTPPCPAPVDTDFSATIDLNAGASLVFSVSATIAGTAGTENITNTASVSLPPGLVDANTANNASTEVTPPNIDLGVTKSDGLNVDTYTPGSPVNYTVTVTNYSAISVNGATVIDNIPTLIDPTTWVWTCGSAPGPPGGTCAVSSGSGNINVTVNLPPGASVNFAISATINAAAVGDLVNTASVSPPTGFSDSVPGNNTATDTDFNAVGEPDVGSPDGNVYTIPDGGTATFYLSQAIVADGDSAADFVFYEYPMQPGIRLDQVIIEISANGTDWFPVFYWGDTVADTNTNIDYASLSSVCPTEIDNCAIPEVGLYPYPGTGITIDVDNSPLSAVPQANYRWIRFIEPGLGSTDGSHVDAIEILP